MEVKRYIAKCIYKSISMFKYVVIINSWIISCLQEGLLKLTPSSNKCTILCYNIL